MKTSKETYHDIPLGMSLLIRLCLPIILFFSSAFNQPDPKSFFENGMASMQKKDYIQAIGQFTNAISLKPDYADAYYQRAYAKDLLGKKMGFFSSELCFDFIMALRYGKSEAAEKLEKSCMGECFNRESAFLDPEIVLCADFSSEILTDLPAHSEKLTYLIKLNFFNNKATVLTDNFGKLKNLISLDLSSNKITTVKPSIGNLVHLKDLNLNKNSIQELPLEFGNLRELKILNLRQNQLTSLPRSIAMLNSLETLDLALNKLTVLPVEIANLRNLQTLILVGNDIPVKEQTKIKALLPNTKIYFE